MAFKVIKTKNAVIELRLDKLETLLAPKKIVTKPVVRDLGRSIKAISLALVKVGKSPVKGFGRFKPYAAQRKRKGYPELPKIRDKYPRKKTRPVNLFLDGKYLQAITKSRINKTRDGIEYGLIDGTALQQKMFESHNEGKRPDIPQRKVVPTGGDDFTALIRRKIKNIYLKRVRSIIKSA